MLHSWITSSASYPSAVQVLGYENAEQLEMLGGNAVVNVDDGADEILQ